MSCGGRRACGHEEEQVEGERESGEEDGWSETEITRTPSTPPPSRAYPAPVTLPRSPQPQVLRAPLAPCDVFLLAYLLLVAELGYAVPFTRAHASHSAAPQLQLT